MSVGVGCGGAGGRACVVCVGVCVCVCVFVCRGSKPGPTAAIAWQLGNEPNSLRSNFKVVFDGLQLGERFIELALLKGRIKVNTPYYNPLVPAKKVFYIALVVH